MEARLGKAFRDEQLYPYVMVNAGDIIDKFLIVSEALKTITCLPDEIDSKLFKIGLAELIKRCDNAYFTSVEDYIDNILGDREWADMTPIQISYFDGVKWINVNFNRPEFKNEPNDLSTSTCWMCFGYGNICTCHIDGCPDRSTLPYRHCMCNPAIRRH